MKRGKVKINKPRFIIAIIIIIAIVLVVFNLFRTKFELENVDSNNVANIELRTEEKYTMCYREDETLEIINTIFGKERKTTKKFDEKFLKGYTEKIYLQINTLKDTKSYSIVNKKNRYYIIDEKVGIFKISKKDYEKIKDFLNKEEGKYEKN